MWLSPIRSFPARRISQDVHLSLRGFWKHVKRLGLADEAAAENLSRLLALPVTEVRAKDLAANALRLAIEHDISAYDATYIAAAEHANGPLVERFRGEHPPVLSISDALVQHSPRATTKKDGPRTAPRPPKPSLT